MCDVPDGADCLMNTKSLYYYPHRIYKYIHNPSQCVRMDEIFFFLIVTEPSEFGIRMIKERNIVCMQIFFVLRYIFAIDYYHHLIS